MKTQDMWVSRVVTGSGERAVAVRAAEKADFAGKISLISLGVLAKWFILPIEHNNSMVNRAIWRLDADQQFSGSGR
jgi:hypothetical protein